MKITFADRARIAGKELAQGNFGNVVKSLFMPQEALAPSLYRGDSFNDGFWLFPNSGCDRYFTWENADSSLNAYKRCPPVAAILNKQAQAYANGKTWLLNTQGKAKNNEAKGEIAARIRTLQSKPNYIQSGQQFEAQVYMMRKLFGRAVILLDKPFGFPAHEATAMWVIPNWMLSISESDALFYKSDKIITRIQLKYKNNTIDLPLENIVYINDFTPSLESVAIPVTRIEALQMPINNVIGAYESRYVLIHQRGPQYVISNGQRDKVSQIPLTPDEKKKLETDFSYKYGLTRNQAQAIITSASIDVQTIGYDVGQLKLHEEVAESSIAICNGLSYPPFLLGLSDATYNNQAEASRGLYMETIIPEAQQIMSQWNVIFNTAAYNIEISKDYSHVSSLQEDRQKQAAARKIEAETNGKLFYDNIISLNRYLELMDEDVRTDDIGSKYYYELLQMGWQFGTTKPVAPPAEPATDTTAMTAA